MKESMVVSLLNLTFFAIFVGMPTISPDVERFNFEAFGEKPFGVPVTRFLFLMMAGLYLPFVPAACGLARLMVIRNEIEAAVNREDWQYAKFLKDLRPTVRKRILYGVGYAGFLFALCIGWTTYRGV